MSGHTPGPWFAVNVGDDDEPMYSVKAARIAGKEPRHEVALCATGDSPQEMETANARLIAAAPELKGVLEPKVLDQIAAKITGFDHSAADVLRDMAMRQRRVLAKAEGRQP